MVITADDLRDPYVDGDRPLVLLVEDEEPIRRLFRNSFKEFHVAAVGGAEEARDLLRKSRGPLGVIIADYYLPDGTGVDVLSEVRQTRPDTLRLLTTSQAHLQPAIEAVNSGGISAYITKPWALTEVRQIIHQSLELYQQRVHQRALVAGRRETLVALAASLAHELRTPLANIQLRSQAMAGYWATLVASYRLAHGSDPDTAIRPGKLKLLEKSLDVIQQEVERTKLTVDMLLASANMMQRAPFESGLYSVRRCITDALERYPFDEANSHLVTLEEGPDFLIYGSDILFSFTLYNLLRNALHAIEDAGQGNIRISTITGKDSNEVHVRDTGSGIAQDVLPHIFDDFFTTRKPGTGTGIGLSFCRDAMQKMGGSIRCESEKDIYTRFILSFPVLRPD